jgi:tRNA pseudouridine55 synthase
LARDIGESLNNGAYLTQLRRTKIGEYDVKEAWGITEFENYLKNM